MLSVSIYVDVRGCNVCVIYVSVSVYVYVCVCNVCLLYV